MNGQTGAAVAGSVEQPREGIRGDRVAVLLRVKDRPQQRSQRASLIQSCLGDNATLLAPARQQACAGEPGGECFGVGEQVGAELWPAAVDGVGEVECDVAG